MPIELDCVLLSAESTNQAGVHVRVSVRNTGPETVEVPSAWDMSGALRFEVFDARWEMVRAIDGLTRQLLTTSSRVDERPWLDRLPPGGSWTRELNLSEWHYPLPEGEYQFVARLTYPPSEIDAECPPLPLRVTPGRLQAVSAAKDNPGLERLLLLLNEESPEGRFYRTRFYSSMRPLVVRAEAALPADAAAGLAIPAQAEFTRAETFEPFYQAWIVLFTGAELRAVSSGPEQPDRRASIPTGRVPLPVAHYDAEHRLYVYFIGDSRRLECYALTAGQLAPVFRLDMPGIGAASLLAREDGVLDVFTPRPLLTWRRVSAGGEIVDVRVLSRRPRPFVQLAWHPQRRELAALVSDSPHGRSVAIEIYTPEEGLVRTVTPRNLPRGVMHEASIDLDARGRVHALLRFGKRLYFYSGEDGPRFCAELPPGAAACFPRVCAARNIFLGYDSWPDGYRFRRVNFARGSPRLVDQ